MVEVGPCDLRRSCNVVCDSPANLSEKSIGQEFRPAVGIKGREERCNQEKPRIWREFNRVKSWENDLNDLFLVQKSFLDFLCL